MSRHRGLGLPLLRSHPVDFTPTHCAGTSCFHNHPGEQVLPVFADLSTPVARCERNGTHGGHDITTDAGDFRCPGRVSAAMPAPLVVSRAAKVRAEIRGGAR